MLEDFFGGVGRSSRSSIFFEGERWGVGVTEDALDVWGWKKAGLVSAVPERFGR